MNTRIALRHLVAASVLGVGIVALAACDKDTPPAETATPPQHTAMDAVNNTLDQSKAAASQTGNAIANDTTAATQSAGNSMPGLPSVNGTSTSNLSTADAAAQRVLDELQNSITKGDTTKAKTLANELSGMRNSLSPEYQAKVDAALKTLPQ
jgi:hypothetical protein